MADLSVLAPAKINLHLEVLGLRPDRFHELAMVMQTIDLADTLELTHRDDAQIRLHCDRDDLPSDGSNLIVKAAEGLRRHCGRSDLGADLRLRKRIPIGAGLAGGSSDGAAALRGLVQLWNLDLSDLELHVLAAELGSDVPFCLDGGSQFCFGRGERLEPLALGAPPPLGVLLIKDPFASVSTPWAYGRCRELRGDFYLESEADFEQRRSFLRTGPLQAALRGERAWPPLRNDLQSVVEPEQASVRTGLALLRRAEGAIAVAMSGSGPSLFALFPSLEAAELARESMGQALAQESFESWCCGFTGAVGGGDSARIER
ncbi:MAG: 4-(cytidine 5'-diphospho)-2-C-methyl-D-erythritol kinase [Prochlorococcaceae cyanobacterium]